MATSRDDIWLDILVERARQEELKKEGRFPFTCADDIPVTEKFAILMEEIGEVARAVVEEADLCNDKHDEDLRKELVQCATVILGWLESL